MFLSSLIICTWVAAFMYNLVHTSLLSKVFLIKKYFGRSFVVSTVGLT